MIIEQNSNAKASVLLVTKYKKVQSGGRV